MPVGRRPARPCLPSGENVEKDFADFRERQTWTSHPREMAEIITFLPGFQAARVEIAAGLLI
jgi:hypothetical protein